METTLDFIGQAELKIGSNEVFNSMDPYIVQQIYGTEDARNSRETRKALSVEKVLKNQDYNLLKRPSTR